MMITSTSKGGGATATTPTQPSSECCMCGDYGLSYELFRCKVCQFRSQHRYCSNQYPKAESYRVCNWCLNHQNDDLAVEKTQNSSNSSSSCRIGTEDDDHTIIKPNKMKKNSIGSLRDRRRPSQMQLPNTPIKKQRSPQQQSPAALKRIMTIGAMADSTVMGIKRSKSDQEILSNGGGYGIKTKQVFRNKVRRYKLLDEVSSQ